MVKKFFEKSSFSSFLLLRDDLSLKFFLALIYPLQFGELFFSEFLVLVQFQKIVYK